MKKPTLSTLAVIVMTTMLLTGCGSDDDKADLAEAPAQKQTSSKQLAADELKTFISLHKMYCESNFSTRESLVKALETDERFHPAAGFNGVYETNIAGVSYAVSPEVDGCTTDVLVQDATTGELLFSYDEINKALVANGYQEVGTEGSRKDTGQNKQELTILEKTFVSPRNEVTNLDYPADHKDQYYMTLFVKKFEPVETVKEISFNTQN